MRGTFRAAKQHDQYRGTWGGWVLTIALVIFVGGMGHAQKLDPEGWKNRFEESFQRSLQVDKVPASVRTRFQAVLFQMAQEGFKQGHDPAEVGRVAADFARQFDEDTRRGVPAQKASSLYRQMSQLALRNMKELKEQDRSVAMDTARNTVSHQRMGKSKDKGFATTHRRSSKPSGGTQGGGSHGGTGGEQGSSSGGSGNGGSGSGGGMGGG